MTWRSNTSSTVASDWTTSRHTGLGVPASEIPSTGENGAGYLYADIADQGAISTDEFRGVITSYPAAGTLTTYEDSSFSFTGAPDGIYTANYTGYRNGVSYGNYTLTFEVGTATTPFIGTVTKQSLVVTPKALSLTTGTVVSFIADVVKASLSVTPKSLSLVTGSSIPFIGDVVKGNLSLSGKSSTASLGFESGVNKSTLSVTPQPLVLITGQGVVPFIADINKLSLTVNSKTGVVQVGFEQDINKSTLAMTFKAMVLINGKSFPVNTKRVFFIEGTSNRFFSIK